MLHPEAGKNTGLAMKLHHDGRTPYFFSTASTLLAPLDVAMDQAVSPLYGSPVTLFPSAPALSSVSAPSPKLFDAILCSAVYPYVCNVRKRRG